MSALVSFDRVFEVLDLHAVHRREARRRSTIPRGAGAGRVPRREVPLPERRRGVAGLAGGRRDARPHRHRAGAARRLVHRRAGADGRAGRPVRRRQVDHVDAGVPGLRRDRRRGPGRRRRRPRRDAGLAARHDRRGHPGLAPVPRDDRGEPALRQARRHRRRDLGGAARRAGRRPGPRPARRARHRWSASAATGSPAARSSASRSPACCSRRRRSSSSTRPPPTSTPSPRRPCSGRCRRR